MDRKKVAIVIIFILVIVIGVFVFISANTSESKITITSNHTLKNGDALTLVLRDNYKNVYPNKEINVKILSESGSAKNYNATTDAKGQATIKLSAFENGNYKEGESFQFIRDGYYTVDKDSNDECLVFNRTVSLKSSFKPQ